MFLNELAGSRQEAIAQLDTVLMLDPKFPFALQNISRFYALDGDYETAVEYALKIKKYYPESPIAYEQLSAYYQDMERFEEAREVSKELLEMSPGKIDILQLLIRIYILERDFENADKYTEMIKEYHADDPYDMITYYNIKENLSRWHGRFKKALEYQENQLELAHKTGDSTFIYNAISGLGHYYNTIFDDKKKALELQREALKYAGQFQPIGHAFNMINIDLSTESEVRELLETQIESFKANLPQEMWALADKFSALFDAFCADDTAAIIAVYEEMSKNPDQFASSDKFEYGKIMIADGQYQKGIDVLSTMITGKDQTSNGTRYLLVNYYIGRAYEGLGQVEKAVTAYREVLKYWGEADVETDDIADTRKRLNRLQG